MFDAIIIAIALFFFCSKADYKASLIFTEKIKSNAVGIPQTNIQIVGRWTVKCSSISPLSIPSFCPEVNKGAIFEFSDNKTLKIYPNQDQVACDVYTYYLQDDVIQIIKSDMVMLVNYKLSKEQLVLKSKTFFFGHNQNVKDTTLMKSAAKDGIQLTLLRVVE